MSKWRTFFCGNKSVDLRSKWSRLRRVGSGTGVTSNTCGKVETAAGAACLACLACPAATLAFLSSLECTKAIIAIPASFGILFEPHGIVVLLKEYFQQMDKWIWEYALPEPLRLLVILGMYSPSLPQSVPLLAYNWSHTHQMLTCTMDKGFGNMILGMYSPSSTSQPQSIPLLSWYIGAIWNWKEPSSTCQMSFRKWLLAAGGRRDKGEYPTIRFQQRASKILFWRNILLLASFFGFYSIHPLSFLAMLRTWFPVLEANIIVSKGSCELPPFDPQLSAPLHSLMKGKVKMFATPDLLVIIVIFPSLPL